MQHPAVLEAAVIGTEDARRPHQDQGLRRASRPATRPATTELKAFVKERLAPYKYPRLIEFVDELPKTATGKIQRFRLREREDGARASERRTIAVDALRRDRLARRAAAHRVPLGRRRASSTRRWSSSCTKAWARSRCGRISRERLCEAARLARPGLLAPRLRPLDAARRATSTGTSTSCIARPTRCCRPCSRRSASPSRPGSSATATAARSRCCTRRASRAWPARGRWRRTSSSRTCRSRASSRRARRLRDDRPARQAWRAITTTPTRRSAAGTTSGCIRPFATGTSRREIDDDPLPGAGGARRGRRIRHAGADPRHRAAIAENPLARDPGLRTFAASRPARDC